MKKKPGNAFAGCLRYNRDGLVPAIIQDYRTGQVLMMAWMNRESVCRTLKTGKTWFFSRSRRKLWNKGETSGNFQAVKQVLVDCDNDCLLIKARQAGNASCHTGYQSCFYRKLSTENVLKACGRRIFDPSKVYGAPRPKGRG